MARSGPCQGKSVIGRRRRLWRASEDWPQSGRQAPSPVVVTTTVMASPSVRRPSRWSAMASGMSVLPGIGGLSRTCGVPSHTLPEARHELLQQARPEREAFPVAAHTMMYVSCDYRVSPSVRMEALVSVHQLLGRPRIMWQGVVQVGDRAVTAHEETPPDQRADVAEHDPQLVDDLGQWR